MEPYDSALASDKFGLNNIGAICYFNSFLQALAGCTAFTRAVLRNAEYLLQTRTGEAMLRYVESYASLDGGRPPVSDTALHSSRVLGALVKDLRERRPRAIKNFGGGQSSASEALVLLLDMMEPAGQPFERENADEAMPDSGSAAEGAAHDAGAAGGAEKPTAAIYSIESPITRLFLHRLKCELHCRLCRTIVSTKTDYMVMFHLLHLDLMQTPPRDAAEFARALRRHVVKVEDYTCERCNTKTTALRVYSLTMVPEILFCAFNLYDGFGRGGHRSRFFPERLEFPATVEGTSLGFRLVGQVEHRGSLSGGHYWMHGLRSGERVWELNDMGVSPSRFGPRESTYILVYHFAGVVHAEQ